MTSDPQSPHLEISLIGGNCPVQAEGTINGEPFYFRARWDHWSLGVGGDPVSAPDRELTSVCEAAGWIDTFQVRQILHLATLIHHHGLMPRAKR